MIRKGALDSICEGVLREAALDSIWEGVLIREGALDCTCEGVLRTLELVDPEVATVQCGLGGTVWRSGGGGSTSGRNGGSELGVKVTQKKALEGVK